MKRIFVYILALSSGIMMTGISRAETPAGSDEFSQEDRQIIENLEFFENFEVLEEDSILIEEYDHIDKISLLGDDDE